MSHVLDETAADVPVRDMTMDVSRLTSARPDPWSCQDARTHQDVSRMSRSELEDRFLHLYQETLQLKEHIHNQDDKIKKLGTKLMRLVKDRGRIEQLAEGRAPPSRLQNLEIEELQEKVRGLQVEKEGLKRQLLVAKQQLLSSPSRRPTPYGHVFPRVNSGLRRLRDDTSSPSQHPRSLRSVDAGGRPPIGLLPRYGHSLLEDARAEICNLESVVESQQSRLEELEGASEQLKEELKRKNEEYEERLVQARQQHTSSLRSQVDNNTSRIKLQKQLADRSNAVTELEGRFLQLQEAQRILKFSHDAAMAKVDELSAQLKDERLKNLQLDKQQHNESIAKIQVEQLQERIAVLEQDRDLLKDNNKKLLNSVFDVSQQQKMQLREQQLKVQISQLETALKADLVDKNEILDKVKAERDKNQQLTEETKELQVKFLEQKQQVEELQNRLKFYSTQSDYSMAELTEALLLVKKRQESRDLGFLSEVDEETSSSMERELRAAHAETILELEKTRTLLNMESRISRDYKAELEAVLQKMNSNKMEFEQKLDRQAQLLDSRAAKISRLEAQLRDITYSTRTNVFTPGLTGGDQGNEFDESLGLEHGENLLELQIVGATLSPLTLQALGDEEPSTFCTYSFYLFGLHSTPVVTGCSPKYGFTSKYVVHLDELFLDYLSRCSVLVELHQALGLDWRTLGTGRLRLQQLLEQDGKISGSIPLVGTSEELQSVGSVDYWIRLKFPVTETTRLYRENLQAVDFIHTSPSPDSQLQISSSSSWNKLFITVQRCSDLQPRTSQNPSPYVVYKFFNYPDYHTATIQDCLNPEFNDLKSYFVLMNGDLDQYLKSEVLQFYVFDYKEKQMDAYLGKARVPLLSLTHNQEVSDVFELTATSGLPIGSITVMLRWRFSYCPPPGAIIAAEEFQEEEPIEPTDPGPGGDLGKVKKMLQNKKEVTTLDDYSGGSKATAAKELQSKPRGRNTREGGSTAKRVTFMETIPTVDQVLSKGPQSTTEEEEDEESHVSEGQLVPSAQSDSNDSDVSEEMMEEVEEAPAAADHQTESTQSDSDDSIVQGPSAGRKPFARVRIEVVSLSLTPQSRLALDDSVVLLFVEYNFLDLPTEETPISLPKPQRGFSINYNYSKVIPVDAENNRARRLLLREVLQGRNPDMERIRFMVVSDPPAEEEQEKECKEVGVAYLSIPQIMERQKDLIEARLQVFDLDDSSEVLASLTVSVEGLDVLRAIVEDQELE